LLPLEALAGTDGRPTVFVVRNGQVASQAVQLGPTDGPRVQIVQGVDPDAEVVLQGKELVRDGMVVKAVPAKVY
jgi:hypothetical protein